MDYKRANRAYLYMILATLTLVLLLTAWVFTTGGSLSIIASNILSELMILVPAIATILYHGDRLGVLIPFKRIKISSVLLTMLYVVLLFPLVTFINSVSMLFVDNTIVGLSDEITGMPMWEMFLLIGIFGPLVEEIQGRDVEFRLLIMPCYPTPVRLGSASKEAVPYLLYDSSTEEDGNPVFSEKTALEKGYFYDEGYLLLNHFLEAE